MTRPLPIRPEDAYFLAHRKQDLRMKDWLDRHNSTDRHGSYSDARRGRK